MMRHGILVTCLALCLVWFMGCATCDGLGAAEAGRGEKSGRGETDVRPVPPQLPPGQPGVVQDITVDVFLSPNPRCYRERCEAQDKGGRRDCNAQCAQVTPLHAQVYYHPRYERGVPPEEGGYTPGLPREVRWHIQCVKNPTCLQEESCEECIVAENCLDEDYTVVIKPAHKTIEQKEELLAQAFKGRRSMPKGCRDKHAPYDLFFPENDGVFKLTGPNNLIYSGPPRSPKFEEHGCSEGQGGRMIGWYYDLEIYRGDRLIMRLDPEIWVQDDGE